MTIDGLVIGLTRLALWAVDAGRRLAAMESQVSADIQRLDGQLSEDDVRMLLTRHADRLRREGKIARSLHAKLNDAIHVLWAWHYREEPRQGALDEVGPE